MNTSTETIMYYIIAAGILSIVYGFITGRNILNSSSGNSKMLEIASAIQEGARAYLNRQYKTIAIVGIGVLIIITILFKSRTIIDLSIYLFVSLQRAWDLN